MLTGCKIVDNRKYIDFQYSDNFTEKDIVFVKSLEKNGEGLAERFSPIIMSLVDVIRDTQGNKGFYQAELDINNPYFICHYYQDNTKYDFLLSFDNIFETSLNKTNFKWYKFENCDFEELPQEIDGMIRGETYILFDGVIVRDIAEGTEQNLTFTYYAKRTENFNIFGIWEDMLFYYSKGLPYFEADNNKHLFLTYVVDYANEYQSALYSGEDETKYLLFYTDHKNYDIDNLSNNDYLRYQLGEFYDKLVPYFERLEELDTTNSYFFGIDINKFEEVLLINQIGEK